MEKYVIKGRVPLDGEVTIAGAKNAAVSIVSSEDGGAIKAGSISVYGDLSFENCSAVITSTISGEGQFADFSEDFQTFYVTNCSQVKQLAVNRSNSTYPLKMYIYECTLNDDGTLTSSETAIQTKQNTTTNTKEVLASDELDPSKIYKVAIFNDFSKLYEIGFKTSLSTSVAGDVNGDGQVTSVDITVLYNFLLSGDTNYMVNGDQNQDGEITAGDVTFVYNILLGVN